jgi:hypothetical protein
MKKYYRFLPILFLLSLIFTSGCLFAQPTVKPASKPTVNKVDIDKDAKKYIALYCELAKLENQEIAMDEAGKFDPSLGNKIEKAGNALDEFALKMGEKYNPEKNKMAADLYSKSIIAGIKKCPRPQ